MMPGHFNSRPHKEVDTIRNPNHTTRCAISTHDLTRRSTEKRGIDGGLSEFQLTTSQGGRPLSPSAPHLVLIHFNSRPHKEVDHPQPELFGLRVVISTHDLTRRSTKLEGMLTVVEIFQLTTSRGGRPTVVVPSRAVASFQLTTSRGGRPSVYPVISL